MNVDEIDIAEENADMTNGASWTISHYVNTFLDVYGLTFLHQCIGVIYAVYLRLTLFNVVLYFLKYVPTGVYLYMFMKNLYFSSRERLKQTQMELEDIQLQIQIVNTKLCVRDAEFNERTDLLRRETDRLQRVRTRIRELIATDEELRKDLETAAECDSNIYMHIQATSQEDKELILDLLKNLKRDQSAVPERNFEKMDCGEHAEKEPTPENSLYSSISDVDVRDCRVKIVKVTNVYKVAYLKHYIKQKQLRRANKRAALRKKMESIKKQLDDWQKTLNMVINSKLTILNIEAHPIDLASQEAMGDYSKPRESDSDSDLRNDNFDEYSWTQNPYRPYACTYEDVQETAVSREHFEQDNGDTKYQHNQCDCMGYKASKMMPILEETGSQMAIEEVANETSEDGDCRDLVAI